ncbi:RNA polymerase sigma factor SigX [Thalassoglobus neptunius]|uniref:RNA polymerase sigma factor SigX n=1 Tax=Thalassoglobus neptunius TaxID=1938619 RepID=A0A5C5VTQ3_9PLAN|nr:sigma-70 family RNA polymerase sigma factor [Thalassoglobus neptunius]TWT40862.1 RNA polymerase sigma factor SigX [Thalassoglobus neptunius]
MTRDRNSGPSNNEVLYELLQDLYRDFTDALFQDFCDMVYSTFEHQLYWLAWSWTKDKHLAEDALHIGLKKFFDTIRNGKLKDPSKPFNFLKKIVKHETHKNHRLRNKLSTQSLSMKDDDAKEWDAEDPRSITPDEEAAIDEIEKHVCAAIERLPENLRAVIRLRFFEGLLLEEIANKLGASVTTIKVRIKRAISKLQWDLSEKGHAPER